MRHDSNVRIAGRDVSRWGNAEDDEGDDDEDKDDDDAEDAEDAIVFDSNSMLLRIPLRTGWRGCLPLLDGGGGEDSDWASSPSLLLRSRDDDEDDKASSQRIHQCDQLSN